MKYQFVFGSMLLIASATAQAQPELSPGKAPPLLVPRAPGKTPALDAFAANKRTLKLQTRWVQIDADALPDALPAWNKLGAGAWSHVAAPDELAQLAQMSSVGTSSVFSQQLYVTNNQTTLLSFSPFDRPFKLDSLEPSSIDEMVIPHANSIFDSPPYIPNLAKPESRLPEMAPMPGAGGKNAPPFIAPLRAPNLYLRPQMSSELADLMAYKFQLRPTLIGDRAFALELKSLNSADNMAATATVNPGETAVFSLPNIVVVQGAGKVRRTFLLVTPRPAMPVVLPQIPTQPTP